MNDLDDLLRSWNKRNEPSEESLVKLRQQAMARLSTCPSLAESHAHRTSAIVSKRRGNVAVAFAFAASVLVAFGTFRMTARFDDQSSSDALRIVAASTQDSQSLFSELERMFDGRWQSLSEIDGHVQLQTSETNGAPTETGVAIRLTVLKRQSKDAGWTIVWDASIISHAGEWVRLPADRIGGDSISVWSYALPDGSMMVESDLALTKPVSIQLAEPSIVNSPSQPTQLWSEQRADCEFQLIQSVSRLEANRG